MLESALLVWVYTFVFALIHSLTASNTLKKRIYKLGVAEHHYRLIYSIMGVFTTVIWLALIHSLPDSLLYQVQDYMRYFLYVLQLSAIIIFLMALVPIDGAVFLGLKKAEKQVDPFVVQGIYKYIRHPMYSGAMLFLLASPEQTWNGLHFAFIVCLYFIVGSKLEERRMLREHPDYIEYKKSVGAFVPKLWNRG